MSEPIDEQSAGGTRRVPGVALLVIVVAAAAMLCALAGGECLADLRSLASVASIGERISPRWIWGSMAAAVVAGGGLTAYLAFGRHLLLKAACVAAIALGLAAPGLALGFTSGSAAALSESTAETQATVAETREVLRPTITGKAVNILLLGSDDTSAGNRGRTDTIMILRLDPATNTAAILSLPRDLRVSIPGHGVNKLNAAYTYGGVALTVKTVERLTGLPIHHFARVDFDGFWRVVKTLGGVYLSVDRRYYVPESAGYKSIDLQPGYQLVKPGQALNFVRYRHDTYGDFTRMLRQQLFLREVQRQAARWNGNWSKVIRMVKAISKETTTDLDSLDQILPIVGYVLDLNTAKVTTVRVTGSTPTIGGVSYVVATPAQIKSAVAAFLRPSKTTAATSAATSAASASSASASPVATASASATASVSVATRSSTSARSLLAGWTTQRYAWSSWKQLATKTRLTLQAPTIWDARLSYEQFRAYRMTTTAGKRVGAAVVTGTYGTGTWSIQALSWTDPPAIANPSSVRVVDGRTYSLFKQGGRLHMVAWEQDGTLYWVLNTLDDQVPDRLLLALAVSCTPVPE